MDQPHYGRAPITEAVIDLRVEAHSVALEGITALATDLRQQFPTQSPIVHGQFSVALSQGDEKGIRLKRDGDKEVGIRLTNKDSARVLQITKSGFTYSHLPPYSSWAKFSSEATVLWKKYVEAARPSKVVRCALRFINKIDMEGSTVEPSDYFHLYPHIPSDISSDMTGMFMQLRMPQDDIDAEAIINSTLVDSGRENVISVLLDFDVFQSRERDPSDPGLWEALEKIRQRKNMLFNSCLTDRAKEQYR